LAVRFICTSEERDMKIERKRSNGVAYMEKHGDLHLSEVGGIWR